MIKIAFKNIFHILAHFSLYIYPYRLGILLSKIKNKFISYRFTIKNRVNTNLHLEVPFTIIGEEYIEFQGEYFQSKPGLRIECFKISEDKRPKLIIKNNVIINYRCHIGVINHIEIGNNVLIGSNVLITDHAHGTSTIEDLNIPPSRRNLISKGPVIIRDNVWIGENVCILPNVTIGEGAIIGANSVVTKVVPPFSLCCGNPAKVIKTITVEG